MRKTSELIWQDTQHQELFAILDDLGRAGSGADVIKRLQLYTETHFTLEERYMEMLNYPGIAVHRKAHDDFREEISLLAREGDAFDDDFRKLVSTYLSEWLKLHVFGIDKKLEEFILQSACK
ncbi:hypothetical protein F0M18_09655 [Pseudohalioglobus sediminis]|uniref:Hemerythrin-like domain-containing protein n=1 Tax=Pseudohalioglobus sediminis TaxID=2606449 RepID=A0A5B0X0C3_9GAMM|nr:hemerythrin family protein [Pseudohalioglobus sediminis]KAA1191791.1 hypothetical protein F0M18_09655 [Pseudohalioglobus sediminis]